MRHPYPYYRASLRDFGKRRVRGCAGRTAWATGGSVQMRQRCRGTPSGIAIAGGKR